MLGPDPGVHRIDVDPAARSRLGLASAARPWPGKVGSDFLRSPSARHLLQWPAVSRGLQRPRRAPRPSPLSRPSHRTAPAAGWTLEILDLTLSIAMDSATNPPEKLSPASTISCPDGRDSMVLADPSCGRPLELISQYRASSTRPVWTGPSTIGCCAGSAPAARASSSSASAAGPTTSACRWP